jgi:hypothetical protein
VAAPLPAFNNDGAATECRSYKSLQGININGLESRCLDLTGDFREKKCCGWRRRLGVAAPAYQF